MSLLRLFTSVLPGRVPASGGGTTNFLRADRTWAAPPGGSGAPDSAEYVVAAGHAGLSAERVATDTGSVTWDFGTAGQAKAHISGKTGITVDGGGSVLTTGIKGDITIPKACTITGVTLLADQTGSIVIDIWKDSYANYPPTVADTITASAKPTISSGVKSQDTTLTGWTTSLSANDTLRFNVDSVTSITRVTLVLTLQLT